MDAIMEELMSCEEKRSSVYRRGSKNGVNYHFEHKSKGEQNHTYFKYGIRYVLKESIRKMYMRIMLRRMKTERVLRWRGVWWWLGGASEL
jgi:hypothetical protein